MADLLARKWAGLAGWRGVTAEDAGFVEALLGDDGHAFASAVQQCRHGFPVTPRRTLEADRDRVAKIAAAAAALLRLVEPEHLALLDNPEPDEFDKVTALLSSLQAGAQRLAEDTPELRRWRGEWPGKIGKGREVTPSYRLSLRLIQAYIARGQTPSLSPDSKLHRLLLIAHRAADLQEPSFSKLRDYVSDFR